MYTVEINLNAPVKNEFMLLDEDYTTFEEAVMYCLRALQETYPKSSLALVNVAVVEIDGELYTRAEVVDDNVTRIDRWGTYFHGMIRPTFVTLPVCITANITR